MIRANNVWARPAAGAVHMRTGNFPSLVGAVGMERTHQRGRPGVVPLNVIVLVSFPVIGMDARPLLPIGLVVSKRPG